MASLSRKANARCSIDELHRIKDEVHKLPGIIGNTQHMVARAKARRGSA